MQRGIFKNDRKSKLLSVHRSVVTAQVKSQMIHAQKDITFR